MTRLRSLTKPQPSFTPVSARLLQRKCAECRNKRLQHRTMSRATPAPVPPIIDEVLRSPGQPLDTTTRAFMEPRFGHDFARVRVRNNAAPAMSDSLPGVSHPRDESEREADRIADWVLGAPPRPGPAYDFGKVRVHTDEKAAESAGALNAQAFTFNRHIVFGAGRYAPSTNEGRHLLAHELTHYVQQRTTGPQVQRRLTVNPSHPAIAPATDPAASLTSAQRFTMMDTLIQSLCDDFAVDHATGDVLSKSLSTPDRAALASGSKPTGCCCLAVLTDTPATWTIEVSQVVGPQTISTSRQVVLSPTTTPVEFGSFTPAGSLAFQGQVPAAGHELCGHAALMELSAHPSPFSSRTTTDVHDPTVRIENLVSSEQGVPAAELRGLAASGTHRGESVDRITIRQYPFNATSVSSLPTSERDKLRFAAAYIIENNSWVDVLGHSDSVGSSSAKLSVSTERANNAQADLISNGVPPTITKFGLTSVPRFTRVEGLSDTQPPPAPLAASPANWRRVELLIAGFPAGAQAPPSGTPTTVTPHPTPPTIPGLKASADPCVALLAGGAYP